MKRFILAVLLFTIFGSLWGQEDSSGYYVKTITIEKVFPHSLGYRIEYFMSNIDMHAVYIPHKMVEKGSDTEIKGEVIFNDSKEYPYISLFYRDGKLEFFRLYLWRNKSHDSWRIFRNPSQHNDSFNVETLNFIF